MQHTREDFNQAESFKEKDSFGYVYVCQHSSQRKSVREAVICLTCSNFGLLLYENF
jgi:hypothetical protein